MKRVMNASQFQDVSVFFFQAGFITFCWNLHSLWFFIFTFQPAKDWRGSLHLARGNNLHFKATGHETPSKKGCYRSREVQDKKPGQPALQKDALNLKKVVLGSRFVWV